MGAMHRLVAVVFGASGFVGGTLVPALARRAHAVRCVSREPARIEGELPSNALRIQADLLDESTLDRVLAGADVVYYLAHALGERDGFAALEERAARNFARAVARSPVRRIVYLGALAREDADGSSDHISSRHRVGEILRQSGVPVTEFRASVVIGAGSMPFEVVRALVERLPVMVTPRWVRTPIQPIAESDLVAYLMAALDQPGEESRIYEIGGASVVDYEQLMEAYGRARGLRRIMIPVPVITPRLSSLWLKLVTPAHFQTGRRVVASAEHASVVEDRSALRDFDIRPMGLEQAVHRALADEGEKLDALEFATSEALEGQHARRVGTRFIEQRACSIAADADACFEAVSRIGGESGWYWGDWLWRLRGALDRLVGGPGMRRGAPARRPPEAGDTIDFWTVVRCEPGSRLTLRADMRLPGQALLDLRVRPLASGARIEQTASFDARGLLGIAYWLALHRLHALVFDGMLRGLAREAEARARARVRRGAGGGPPAGPPPPGGYDLSIAGAGRESR